MHSPLSVNRVARDPGRRLSVSAVQSLAKAAPDGYTIGVGTAAGLAINPAIMKENLSYSSTIVPEMHTSSTRVPRASSQV